MISQQLVSVIILHFGHPEVTEECLAAVLAQSHSKTEIFLINNGSNQMLSEVISLADERVTLLVGDMNKGYAAGNNDGIRLSKGEYVVVINNDVILPVSWIEKMLHAWPGPEWGLLSSSIVKYGSDQELQYSGFTEVTKLTGRNRVLRAGERWTPEDKVTETAYAHGSAMVASRAAIDLVGMIPEQYFLHYEELDWSEKMKRAGLKVGVYHGVEAPHYGSLTLGKDSPNRWYYYHRGRLIFQRRWLTPGQKIIFFSYYLLVASPKEVAGHIFKRKWSHLAAWKEAMVWHLSHLRTIPGRTGPRKKK